MADDAGPMFCRITNIYNVGPRIFLPPTNQSKMVPLDQHYLERVYAGVLGKLVGVYLGRPFEGWTHQKIMDVLGPIRFYVHDHPNMPVSPWDPTLGMARDKGLPLVVTDDDVSGTFTFLRALEEHGFNPGITSEQIGKTWLNQIIEGQTILWWGGRGVSTEHTAYLNLKNGVPAPRSGAIVTNGKTVAEQIGAQIFIDGWAMVAPGNPKLAAYLAQQAGSVSHDGESVYAAMLWAAMEAEAFVSKDVNHLLDTGLSVIPPDSAIAKLIADIRQWHATDQDWLTTRQRIEDTHGYDKYHGVCHIMPNHGIMILALLYSGHDFTEAMYIINTCGWDTDCNSGNIGCLLAIMHGLAAFEGSADWRGPVGDRALISSADGGFSIANATSLAYEVANIGRQIAGEAPFPAPKDGAQFHFSLPGGVQGFSGHGAQVRQESNENGNSKLIIDLDSEAEPSEVLTQTFAGKDVLKMPIYPLMASPLLYPGQTVKAKVKMPEKRTSPVLLAIRLKVYAAKDELVVKDGEQVEIYPGDEKMIEWTIPDDFDSQPIQSVGLAIFGKDRNVTGEIHLESLRWTGGPRMTLTKPTSSQRPGSFWMRAWVNAVDTFRPWGKSPFCIIQNRGEGMITHGTREWTDYRVTVSNFLVQLGHPAGVAIRVRGLHRYYAFVLTGAGKTVSLVKAYDENRIVLASTSFDWRLDEQYEICIQAVGSKITGQIGDVCLNTEDHAYKGGGLGLIVTDGAVTASHIKVEPA